MFAGGLLPTRAGLDYFFHRRSARCGSAVCRFGEMRWGRSKGSCNKRPRGRVVRDGSSWLLPRPDSGTKHTHLLGLRDGEPIYSHWGRGYSRAGPAMVRGPQSNCAWEPTLGHLPRGPCPLT